MMETNRGTYGWILFVVTMPISLFYRYHCTVCLSQCFNKLYEDEVNYNYLSVIMINLKR